MFDDPLAILRWVIIFGCLIFIISRYKLFVEIFSGRSKKRNDDKEVENKVDELLRKWKDENIANQ